MTDETETAPVIDPVETPETEASTHGVEDTTEAAPEPEGELVIQIGDEEPEPEPDDDTETFRNLRRLYREAQKELKELKSAKAQEEVPALPAKPKLDDFDYDTEVFEAALEAWYETKRTVEAKEAEARKAAEQAQQSWQAKVASYQEAKAKVPFADFDDAEAFVQDTFDATQQGLLIKVAKDAPTLVYALGKNHKAAANLAGIKDYAEFVAEAVRLEMNVKTTRKPATSPEKTVTVPTGLGVTAADNTLERLREEAAKTGDYSKVHAYKRQMRA